MKKTIIVKQHDLTDCGPACLSSIARYYGGYIPIELLRIDCKTDRNGTSAYNLIQTAKKYGFSCDGIKINNLEELKALELPLILHLKTKNNYGHFVVLYYVSKREYIIMDPAQGRIKIKKNDLEFFVSGVVITFKPIKQIPTISKPKSVKLFFKEHIVKYKSNLICLFFINLFLILILIILGNFIKLENRFITMGFGLKKIVFISLIFLLLYILKGFLDFLKNNIFITMNKSISNDLLSSFNHKIFNLPLNFIKSKSSGEIIARYNELLEINDYIPKLIVSTFVDLIIVLFLTPFLIIISFKLTIVLLIFSILYLIICFSFNNPTLQKVYENINCLSSFNTEVISCVNVMNTTKFLNNDENMEKRLKKAIDCFVFNTYKLDNYLNKLNFLKNLIIDICYFTIILIGLSESVVGNFNVVNLFTFILLINYFIDPIKDVSINVINYNYIKASITKLNEFSLINNVSIGIKPFVSGDIVIQNLSYAYNGIDNIIHNFSCNFKSGYKILLKGSSGCGKSTLCMLISKQINSYKGDILINNININQINDGDIRKNVTYIGQKESLLIDTIENNIKYERNVKDKDFKNICNICEIDNIVKYKVEKYQTMIDESSNNISGGEKQRISLARGLINSGSIIILDESLSEVNKDMEERIIKRLFRYYKDKTIIYVSHKDYDYKFDQVVKMEWDEQNVFQNYTIERSQNIWKH